MGDYAANCPISRPVRTGARIDADFGGIMWSDHGGFCFEPTHDYVPMREPAPYLQEDMHP